MKRIKGGIEVPRLEYELSKIGDLIYHEGPLLSHFINAYGEDYFFRWVDKNNKSNRWIVYKVSKEDLRKFFEKKLSHKDLVLNTPSGLVHFIDIDDEINFSRITVASVENIPPSYLPPDTAVYNPSHYEKYAKELAESLKPKKEEAAIDEYLKHSIAETFGKRSLVTAKVKKVSLTDYYSTLYNQFASHAMTLPVVIYATKKYEETKERQYRDAVDRAIDNILQARNYISMQGSVNRISHIEPWPLIIGKQQDIGIDILITSHHHHHDYWHSQDKFNRIFEHLVGLMAESSERNVESTVEKVQKELEKQMKDIAPGESNYCLGA